MRMRISLALGRSGPVSRQTAWGCLTANLAVPGAGSLAAGRRSGYAQMLLTVAGLILSTIFGLQFILWQLANWGRLHSPELDPLSSLNEVWRQLRWALLGLAVFGVAWLWALGSSLIILQSSRDTGQRQVPPRI